eukprot:TRINITY_DN36825_c0_g1_i1.p1 TRINITY_DN36825_c0_g1~~TRINITY_DN36825_c0_g1_i1.p1  ORF type:complete len:109 (+),score=10.86 TRINITY_DN36825_c0_g1_i1:41-328(+)
MTCSDPAPRALQIALLATRTPAELSEPSSTVAVRHIDGDNKLWLPWNPAETLSRSFSIPIPPNTDLGDTLSTVVVVVDPTAPSKWSKVVVETYIG